MQTDMQRRGFLAFALLCLGGSRAFAAPQATDDLAGIWSAQVRTKGGLGAQMTFTAAGDVTSTFGALIDLKYEIDQDKFKMTIAGPDERPMSTLVGREFKIDGDQLTINQGDLGPPQVMTRVGIPHRDAHPIVGDWSFTHSTGATAVQRFSRNGAAQLSVAMKVTEGTYRMADGMLQIQFAGMPAIALTIKRDGDVLTTTDRNGKDIRFVKFDY